MLLKNKIALITGITNEYSIAYHIAKAFIEQGANVILSYQGERLKTKAEQIATDINAVAVYPCDATIESEISHLFSDIQSKFGGLDIFVHAIAYANKNELSGGITNATQEGFKTAMDISCYSLISMSKLARPLMVARGGGSIMSLTFIGSERSMMSYNAMGCAKAALESATRYLALELGVDNIRVNTISSAPIKTVAARSIPGFIDMYNNFPNVSLLKKNVTADDVAGTAVFLGSNLSSAITATNIYVDGGYHSSANIK